MLELRAMQWVQNWLMGLWRITCGGLPVANRKQPSSPHPIVDVITPRIELKSTPRSCVMVRKHSLPRPWWKVPGRVTDVVQSMLDYISVIFILRLELIVGVFI
jgi:hypothetical protein